MYCHPGTKSLLFSKWLSILVSKFRKFLFNADASIRWTSKEHTMSMAAFVGYNYKKKGSLHINQRLYFDVVHWPSPYILAFSAMKDLESTNWQITVPWGEYSPVLIWEHWSTVQCSWSQHAFLPASTLSYDRFAPASSLLLPEKFLSRNYASGYYSFLLPALLRRIEANIKSSQIIRSQEFGVLVVC